MRSFLQEIEDGIFHNMKYSTDYHISQYEIKTFLKKESSRARFIFIVPAR